MSFKVRVMNTGLRTGRENIAHDQAMIDARLAGDIPDTLKFIQFKPSALIGRHQDLSQELKLDECAARSHEALLAMRAVGIMVGKFRHFRKDQTILFRLIDRSTVAKVEHARRLSE